MATYRVLIVDDEKNIRFALSEVLADMDLIVETASDGRAALDMLDAENFSLVLLDLKMPGLGGIEVLRRLKKARPDVSVVIITAHGTIESSVEAMKLGAVDFLRKPFTPKEVRGLVARIMERERIRAEKSKQYVSVIESAREAIVGNELAEADRLVRIALRIDLGRPQAHNLLGILYEVAGDRFEAQQCYRKALEIDPEYAPALANLRESVEPERKTNFFLAEAKIPNPTSH